MLEQIFNTLTNAMSGYFGIALLAAYGWGVLSILLSPCHLSSIPLVLGYISLKENPTQKKVFKLSLAFALGVLVSIAIVGAITSLLGGIMGYIGPYGNIISAAVLFLTGLYLLDWIKLSWTPIKLKPDNQSGWTGAALLGLVFGIGLGPCTFAYMAPVAVAAFSIGETSLLKAAEIVLMFGLGHCTVIVVSATLVKTLQKYMRWTRKSNGMLIFKKACGVLVLAGGAYFVYTMP
ncbi:MAG: cytochrome C biogenesis protein [Ignavibacteriae bacterium 37-53-5]|nr:MAG: cytochrome C biogenesis protein [Ignavibacteriae bacterium 37-53-5]